jgi:sterol 3beta-glucosyltransferase
MAAAFGLPAYTLKGVEKQIEKRSDRDLKAEILEIRLRQGLAAFRQASAEEKREMLKRWKELGVR